MLIVCCVLLQVLLRLANPNYMPHLSLLYSGVEGEEKIGARTKADALLVKEKAFKFEVSSFELWETPMKEGSLSTKEWTCVADFPLSHTS